jgi:hypothetical protein
MAVFLVSMNFAVSSAYAETGSWSIINRLIDLLRSLIFWFLEIFARGMVEGIKSAASSIFTLGLHPLASLVNEANELIISLGFSIAQFSFFVSLGLYVLPLSAISDEWRAKGENGLIDSCLCVVLLSFTPLIHSFFSTFSDLLSQAIMSSIDKASFIGCLLSILLSLIMPGMFFLLWLDVIALLIAFALIVVGFILSLIAPTLFLIAICVYALPLRIAKNTANKLFVQSIMLYFLKPIGYAILAINAVILSTVISPLTPLIILILDIMILWLTFNISREVGATYPVLGFLRKTMTTAIVLGTASLAPSSARRVVGASYATKKFEKEE